MTLQDRYYNASTFQVAFFFNYIFAFSLLYNCLSLFQTYIYKTYPDDGVPGEQ